MDERHGILWLGPAEYIGIQFLLLLGFWFVAWAAAIVVHRPWSEPEPGIALCQPGPDDYEREHPRADQVLLVIEVAGASLSYDRSRKAAAYAGSDIPQCWLVNLADRRIEVLSDPDPVSRHYRSERYALAGDTLSLPGGVLLAASDILPRY